MKIAAEVNHASTTNVKIHATKFLVGLAPYVPFQIREPVAHAPLKWFPAQQLKSVAFDRQRFHALKIAIALQVQLASMIFADLFVRTMQVV